MRISIIHPSRGRPQQAFETAKEWQNSADYTFEYILSIDSDDPLFVKYIELFDENGCIKAIGDNHSAIEAINNAAKLCTGDLIIVVSDDFSPCEAWDTLLMSELKGKSDFVLKTRDGIQKTLVTLPIMDREYYERYGYIYHPEYKHLFADQDLTATAIMMGKLLYSDLIFNHNHYTTGKTQRDAINDKNDLTWRQGEQLYNSRLRNNFGIANPVKSYREIIWH